MKIKLHKATLWVTKQAQWIKTIHKKLADSSFLNAFLFVTKKLRKASYRAQCIVLKKVLFGAFIILGICDFFVKSIIYDFWPQPFYASL